jgi:hypothetical protein
MRAIDSIKRKILFHCSNCSERIEERLGRLVEIDHIACPNLGCPELVDLEVRKLTPVILPPGRARLATRPSWTGSAPMTKTMGIVELAAFAASAAALLLAKITLGRRETRSAANAGNRSY